MVMEAVYWFGLRGYEGIVPNIWRELCSRSDSILEIGANVGLFSVVGGKSAKGRYTAVEPVPEVASVLRTNLHRNGLSNVEVLEGAVIPGANPCDVQLNVPDEGRSAPVGAHLVEGVEIHGRSQLRQLVVRGYPVGSLISGRDLVKIDAEGIEAELINSAKSIIISARPTLLLEVLPEAERLGALIKELALAVGYSILVIPEYGSETMVQIAPQDFCSACPQRYKSKDVLLSTCALDSLRSIGQIRSS